jgi:hypothetical protein
MSLATGQRVAGKWHPQKAEDTARGLRNWLRRNPGADPHDRLVAQGLYDEPCARGSLMASEAEAR